MPLPDAPIEEWIRVFEPKSYHALGYDGPVPVHGYLIELVESRKQLAALGAFFRFVMEDGCWQGGDIDGGSAQDRAESLGLIKGELYDPAKHGDHGDFVAGEDVFFVFTDLVPKTIRGNE